jgi:hypothetical protein
MVVKNCPKCPNAVPMGIVANQNVLPSLMPDASFDTKSGLYVQAYRCPTCGLVELYHVKR